MLRAFDDGDVPMVRNMSTDPNLPLITTLPAAADDAEALAYIARQHSRLVTGAGWSFCIADASDGHAIWPIA